MILNVTGEGAFGAVPVSMTCPQCRHQGMFGFLTHFSQDVQVKAGDDIFHLVGHRYCPNPKCHAHVVVVMEPNTREVIESFPPALLDFDTDRLPPEVVECFLEALSCHATSNYRAAAMMVRRTLEVLCDVEGAEGDTLQTRIQSLRDRVTLPEALFEAMTDIRLLGNDAAHVKAKNYATVSEAEVHAAVDVTREILKALYQHNVLVERLRELRTDGDA